MNYEKKYLEQKTIVGLTKRTGNQDPDCQKIIGGLWQDFMGKGVCEALENRKNEYCVGLYNNYDFEKMTYDVTVGVEVEKVENAELSKMLIPAGNYAVFHVSGDVVKDVADAWEKIWAMPLERSFAADFEEYLSNENGVAEVDIYIALK